MSEGTPHLTLIEKEGVHIVEFSDRKILEEFSIREIEEELFQMVDGAEGIKLLLNFSHVEHLSSAALGMLINLDKKVTGSKGTLVLSEINPQIYEVFKITRLNKKFEIHDTTAQAMKQLT